MNDQIIVELFTVSIEAFSAVLGIFGAMLIFIIQNRRDKVDSVENQLLSSLRHIRQIVNQIGVIIPEEWDIDNLEQWSLNVNTRNLDGRLLEIIEYCDGHHDEEVMTDHGPSTFYNEYRLYWHRADDLHQQFIHHKNQFIKLPKNILILLIIIMMLILYSLLSLLFLTYNIYIFLVNGYFAFFLDVICIFVFSFYSYTFYRDI